MTEPIYIVCSGASLKDFDFNKLNDKKIIAVNLSCFNIPRFDIGVAIDFQFYEKYQNEILSSNKPFYAMSNYKKSSLMDKLGVHYLEYSGAKGYDERKGFCKHGFNSGYFAVQLALDLGYKEIHVLGMDASYSGSNVYYFNDNYSNDFYNTRNVYSHLHEYMKALKKEMPKDVKIYNYSDMSTIKCFEFKKLSEI